MANRLFDSMQGGANDPFGQLISDAKAFKESFKGNPKDEVERLLSSGAMSQEQFNQYSKIARRVLQAMGTK